MPALEDPKLELYCQERAKMGATDISAYVAAGYKSKDSGKAVDCINRILKNEKVSARIAEIHVEAALLGEVTLSRVLKQLADIAFADIGQVAEWGSTVVESHVDKVSGEIKVVSTNKNWMRLVDKSKVGVGALAAIDKISLNADGSISGVRLRPPMPALVALGRHLGMLRDARDSSWPAHQNAKPRHQIEPLVYVDAGPAETREEWEARQRRRFAEADAARAAGGAPSVKLRQDRQESDARL